MLYCLKQSKQQSSLGSFMQVLDPEGNQKFAIAPQLLSYDKRNHIFAIYIKF